MNVLLLGSRGQLGRLISTSAPAGVNLLALNAQQLDIRAAEKLAETCESFQPHVVINAAAYTQVDKAESEPELALAINHQGVLNLIAATSSHRKPESSVVGTPDSGERRHADDAAIRSGHTAGLAHAGSTSIDLSPPRIIHISTDFVFDGTATRPYRVDDPVSPLGSYGRSKLAGEQALQQLAPQRSCIIRTAWLYADEGKNFLNTMLHLMATRAELKVVNDQRGTPTSAHGLAEVVWRFVGHPLQHERAAAARSPGHEPGAEADAQPLHGIYHWTDSGEATWYEFAMEIQRLALQHGLLERAILIVPITTADYPTPARRPAYSVLDKRSTWAALGVQGSAWQTELDRVLALKKRRQQNG